MATPHGRFTGGTWFGRSRRSIASLCRTISAAGCRRSRTPERYSYRLAQRVADLGQFIERLDLRQVTLVGHDWGGAIGMGAAVAAPERFARFVLMNTAAFRDAHCPAAIRLGQVPILSQLLIQGLNVFARAALRLAVEHHERMTPTVRAGYGRPTIPGVTAWPSTASSRTSPCTPASQLCHAPADRGRARTFAGHPICLIWGMLDWCFGPRFLERFQEFFPAAEVHRLADAGHYVVEDAHERIVPLVEDF